MAKFIYRMQSILSIKGKLEEQAKMEFATARIRLDEEEEKLEALYKRKIAYEQEGIRLRKNNLHIQDIIDNKSAILQMDEYIAIQKIEINKAEKILEQARVRLQEAMQDRKTYERLREKSFEGFMKEENAKESKEVDELTSYTYGKKRGNE